MDVIDWIKEYWNISVDVQWKFLSSALAMLVLWGVKHFATSVIERRVKEVKARYSWKNGVRNIYYAFLIIIISTIWIDNIGSLATFFGLVTAGLAIALQDPIVDFAGWVFILIRRPFEMGDRIEIDGMAGDIIDIRFFQFTVNEINNWVEGDHSTGRIIHIPNGKVFKMSQANYTQGFDHIWNEIGVLLTFESDWESAKLILEDILKTQSEHLSKAAEKKLIEASKKYMIFYKNLSPTIYTSVRDSGVMLKMRYLVNPKKRRTSEHQIWEDVLRSFAKHDNIDFAYPTNRIYYEPSGGRQVVIK